MNEISQNLRDIEKRIGEACARAGRVRSGVTLIAVSKTKPAEAVKEAMLAGQTVFGENRVQELRDKYESIRAMISGDDPGHDALRGMYAPSSKVPCWHLIGTLQTNKVKYLPGIVKMIHSVDQVKLAEEIDKRFGALRGEDGSEGIADILIEVNMAHEDTKMGLAPEDTKAFIKEIAHLKHLNIRGLMTIAPFTDDAESNRVYFRGLRELRDEINGAGILDTPMTELSMGMTGDFEVAIEEGATFIRVGTAIFGERDYNI